MRSLVNSEKWGLSSEDFDDFYIGGEYSIQTNIDDGDIMTSNDFRTYCRYSIRTVMIFRKFYCIPSSS